MEASSYVERRFASWVPGRPLSGSRAIQVSRRSNQANRASVRGTALSRSSSAHLVPVFRLVGAFIVRGDALRLPHGVSPVVVLTPMTLFLLSKSRCVTLKANGAKCVSHPKGPFSGLNNTGEILGSTGRDTPFAGGTFIFISHSATGCIAIEGRSEHGTI